MKSELQINSEVTVTLSQFKRNPVDVINQAEGLLLAVLDNNLPAFYCIPANVYATMIDKLEDIELAEIALTRLNQKEIVAYHFPIISFAELSIIRSLNI